MDSVIPLVISGQVLPTQASILMTIIDNAPYYLVTDIAGNPYFQPLYQDVTTGLDVFTQFAARVTIALGARQGNNNSAVITNLKPPGVGNFLANPLLLKIVAPNSISNAVAIIPIAPLSYKNPGLVACGYEYIMEEGYGFYVTTNWSPTPNTQAIASLQQVDPARGFYVFPVEGLVDSNGNAATTTAFSAIYNDVLGKTLETFLFSSSDARSIGQGEPYYFCADGKCGPGCFGTCARGQSNNCIRLKDKNMNFVCLVGPSTTCKVIALLPFMVPLIICIIAITVVFLTSKKMVRRSLPGNDGPGHTIRKEYVVTRKSKILVCSLAAVIVILIIVMMIMACLDNGGSNAYLKAICKTTGDYQ